jgi:hypothetical protein
MEEDLSGSAAELVPFGVSSGAVGFLGLGIWRKEWGVT